MATWVPARVVYQPKEEKINPFIIRSWPKKLGLVEQDIVLVQMLAKKEQSMFALSRFDRGYSILCNIF